MRGFSVAKNLSSSYTHGIMATRHWTLHLDGETHTVRLEHGYWSGSCQIWVDDKLFEKSRRFIDFGSARTFEIKDHHCELGIATNGFTYDFHLSVDGVFVLSDEDLAKDKKPGPIIRAILDTRDYWQSLERLTGMKNFPDGGEPNERTHRLVGRVEGHFVLVRDGGVVVTFGPGVDKKNALAQIKADPSIAQLHFAGKLKDCLQVRERMAYALLKYDTAKISAEQFAQQLFIFVRIIARWTCPHPLTTCDLWSCKRKTREINTLVLINDVPHLLCDDCVKTLPQLGEAMKHEVEAQPEHFWRGTAAALVSSVVYGLVWGVVWALLEQVSLGSVGAFLFIGAFVASTWAMQKVDALPTWKTILSALLFSTLGVVLGIYQHEVIALLVHGSALSLADALSSSWLTLRQSPDQLRFFIIPHLLISAVGIADYAMKTLNWMKQLSNPQVEIVGDIHSIAGMYR